MSSPVYDVVGIGFGPSNLALAVALEEEYGSGVNAVFFERQPAFGWHRNMLIEGATMQVHFLKDLVTLRNPASSYSFLSYLQDRGRLVDFINHKTMFPTRLEFHDYLEWVASSFAGLVRYDSEVVAVRPYDDDTLEVVVERGDELHTCLTRNLVIAVGLEPVLPDGVRQGDRIWHTEELLARLESSASATPDGSSWSAPGRARPRRSSTCTAPTRPRRSAPSSPGTATHRPTTARSPTVSSTRRQSTTSSPPPGR